MFDMHFAYFRSHSGSSKNYDTERDLKNVKSENSVKCQQTHAFGI